MDGRSPPAGTPSPGVSVRAHLLLLVLGVLLPTLAFAGLAVWRFAEAERARIEARAQDVAREATHALDRSFGDVLAAARVLAGSESLAAGDLAAYHRRAVEAAAAFGGNSSLRDAASRQLVNSNILWGAPLPARSRLAREDARAAETGAPAFSDLFVGLADGVAQFAVVLPLPQPAGTAPAEGEPRFLSLSVPATRVQRILEREITLHPGMVAGVVDRNGVFVARTRDFERFVGRPSARLGWDPSVRAGVAFGADGYGAASMLAYRWSEVSGWRVGVSVPVAVLNAPLRRGLAVLAAAGAGALVLAVAAALLVGRRMTGALGALAAAGEALSRDAAVPVLATPLREANAVGAVLAAAADERRAHEARRARDAAALHLADERFRVALLTAPVTAYTCDRELRYTWIANQHRDVASAAALLGRRDDEVPGLGARPEEIEALVAFKREVLESGRGARRDLTWTARDGALAHYDVTAEPLRDATTGEVVGLTVAALDVTPHVEAVEALRRQEGHQRLLMNELNHRVKNTLAVVQSMAAQTLRGASDPRAAGAALQARLIALAAAHDVLTRKSWEGAPLSEVLEAALAPHRSAAAPDRIAVSGPEVWVPPRVALALALAVHELATNATKYGALSIEAGQVALGWERVAGGRVLRLRWEERGGPRVAPPARRGFGSRLIERGLGGDLGGAARIGFDPAGVVCTLEAALPDENGEPDPRAGGEARRPSVVAAEAASV